MIDGIHIPYDPDDSGVAYNKVMEETTAPWILFMDHASINMHPNWRHVCIQAIKNSKNPGIFGCWLSKVNKSLHQLHMETPFNSIPLCKHRKFAKYIWEKYQYKLTSFNDKECKIDGCFMLINRKAFNAIGGAKKTGLFGVDWNLKLRIVGAGYNAYRIDGLYVYHLRDREPSWIDNIKVSSNFIKKNI